MTHPDLVLRAEQAVIGAALHDRQRLDDIAYLTPDRMAHPTNRALLAALIESRASDPTASVAHLPELIAQRAAVPGVDADYLRRLANSSSEPRNIAIYARMVQEAAVRRDLALHVDRLRAASAGLRGPDPLLDRIGQAMRRNDLAVPVARLDEPAPEPYEPRARQANQQEVRVDIRLEKQDTVLADLLQHPEQIREVSSWLYPEVFDEGLRREAYVAIVAVEERGEPVDPLTVEWEVQRQGLESYEVEVEVSVEARPDYLARLAATAVVVGAAVEISGELMAEDLRASLAADLGRIGITGPGSVTAARAELAIDATARVAQPASVLQPPPIQPESVQPKIRP